jgi:broad specificity phosphatase PhoE
MYTIYIVRHGETDNNKKRVLQGRSNLPLNEAGAKQAEKVKEYFAENGIQFDKVYSSPLIRAIKTAQIITGEKPDHFILDDHLLEMDYGPYEGCSLLDPPQEIIEFFSDFVNNPAPEGMENLPDLVARMGRFMESLKKEGDQTILISTHAIAMKGILEHLTPESHGAYWNKHIANCAVFKTIFKNGEYTVPVELRNE